MSDILFRLLILVKEKPIMCISRFPIEVIDRIITFVSRKIAYQCMFVCKKWHSQAVVVFYSTLNLDSIKGCVMEKKVQLVFRKHCHLVTTLEFGNYILPMEKEKGMAIIGLFSTLPQLKVIDLRRRKDSPMILCALKSALDACPHSMNNLQNVMVTMLDDQLADEQIMSAYYGVCFKRRHSITHMNVYHKHVDHIGYLRDYQSLTHVIVYNYGPWKSSSYERNRLLFAAVLSVCLNLVKLEIFSRPTQAYLHIKKEGPRSEFPIPPPIERSSTVKMYNKNLKNLFLTAESLDIAQMNYIMSYIPTRKLHDMKLYLAEHNTLQEWIRNSHAKITLKKFIKHICLAKKVRFQIDSKYSETEEPTGDEVFQVNTTLWSIARTIENNRKIDHCQIRLTLTDIHLPHEVHPHMQSATFLNKCGLSFDVAVRNHILSISNRLPYSDFFHQNGKSDWAPVSHEVLKPSSTFLSYWTPERFIEDATKVLLLSVPESELINGITFALVNFPHLEKFDINNNANGDAENVQEVLCSRNCEYYETKTEQFAFYKLHLKNATLTKALIDRISLLVRYINELVLEDGIIYDNNTRYNKIELEFTQMVHVKNVTLNFPYILRRYSNTLVQLNIQDRTLYYKSGIKDGKHAFIEVSPHLVRTEPGSVMVRPRITIMITLPNSVESITFGAFKDLVYS